jgi:hypothetical protein
MEKSDMDALECFLVTYREQHPGLPNRMLQRLVEDQVRVAPAEGVNTLVWLLWHMARTEDVVVNRFVGDRPQVWDEGDWGHRLRVSLRQVGVAMSTDQVRLLSSQIDIGALREYWERVGARTEAVVGALQPASLDQVVSVDRVHQAIVDEGICPATPAIYDRIMSAWPGKTNAYMLHYYALGHNLLHAGEAMAIRGLIGPPGP